jgi:hypothetical protein
VIELADAVACKVGALGLLVEHGVRVEALVGGGF